MRPAVQVFSRRAVAPLRIGNLRAQTTANISARCRRTLWTQNTSPALPRPRRVSWAPLAFAAAGAVVLSGALLGRDSVRLDAADRDTTPARMRKSTAADGKETTSQSSASSSSSFSPSSPLESAEAKTASIAAHAEMEASGAEALVGPTESGGEGGDGEGDESSGAGGAYDPVTGEINWDCPCLGGMAHGPCGQEFRAAFSCFVYSEDEPKGINCVELFKSMQDCFRSHPEVYGEEIMADDDDDEGATNTALPQQEGESASASSASAEAVSSS